MDKREEIRLVVLDTTGPVARLKFVRTPRADALAMHGLAQAKNEEPRRGSIGGVPSASYSGA